MEIHETAAQLLIFIFGVMAGSIVMCFCSMSKIAEYHEEILRLRQQILKKGRR